MFGLGPHAEFIVASYAVTGIVLGALVLWAVLGERQQQRMLAELERRGLTRRGPSSESENG